MADAIRTDLGVDVAVMVRSRKELAAVIDANPFGDIADDPKRLLVNFLDRAAGRGRSWRRWTRASSSRSATSSATAASTSGSPKGSGARRWRPRPGTAASASAGTGRNWRTVTTLLEMLDA